jgi:hypothetical protein
MESAERTSSLIERVFKKCVYDCHIWKIPISEKIKPTVSRISRKDCYAVTQKLDSGWFQVSVSDLIWEEYSVPNDALRNILFHELCHTIDGAFNHGKTWKFWVKKLNVEHGCRINPYPYSKKSTDLF